MLKHWFLIWFIRPLAELLGTIAIAVVIGAVALAIAWIQARRASRKRRKS